MPEQRIAEGLPEWIREHLTRYMESDGADGHLWDASLGGGVGMIETLLLTTTGRKSGLDVHIQVAADKYDARARVAEGAEREKLWQQMVAIYAPYEDYKAAASNREIPVVVIEPV